MSDLLHESISTNYSTFKYPTFLFLPTPVPLATGGRAAHGYGMMVQHNIEGALIQHRLPQWHSLLQHQQLIDWAIGLLDWLSSPWHNLKGSCFNLKLRLPGMQCETPGYKIVKEACTKRGEENIDAQVTQTPSDCGRGTHDTTTDRQIRHDVS